MTEKEIAEEFLWLFLRSWKDPEAHHGFTQLREQASGHRPWHLGLGLPIMDRNHFHNRGPTK
jgi:hypothetical protein